MKGLDYLVAALFIVGTILSGLGFSGSDEILINADGKEYYYPLNEDRVLEVSGPLGITTIEIKDNDARIIDSPCPNKTCLNTRMGSSICCLPNRVLITFKAESDEVDAYAF